MKEFRLVITADVKEDLRRYLSYIRNRFKNPQVNMTPVPGTSGGTRVAETLASFFVAEDDSMTVVPGTSGMGVRG